MGENAVKTRAVLLILLAAFSMLLASSFLITLIPAAGAPELEIRARPLYLVDPAADPLAISGYTPAQIRAAYNLPASGGTGTIAIVDAFDAPSMLIDLTYFSNSFGLPPPTSANYEEHHMYSPLDTDDGWALETALDVEWAHAVAPDAKILLVQAKSDLVVDLLAAVEYARLRPDVVAISMSWGADEFQGQTFLDSYFTSDYNAAFFAASGDDGAGVIWPSSSANVVSVGGTTLTLDVYGNVISETAWSGSGGGISSYVPKPSYQTAYGVQSNRRATPDVSYNANANTGFAVYYSGTWRKVGGTSAGAPQWAAIQALSSSAYNSNFYPRASSPDYDSYFRDIISGSNGYPATLDYDYATGLGSPITYNFEESTFTNTTITLFPSGQSTPLSQNNQFTITYTVNGTQQTVSAQDGTMTLDADSHTNLAISGTSTGSSDSEKWVFTSNFAPVNVAAGSSTTLYYFNLLSQSSIYSVAGGGTPSSPAATYYTAPSTASSQGTPQMTSIALSQSTPQTLWPARGSILSVANPIIGSSTEQWTTQLAAWTIANANQVPPQIVYSHQFLLTVSGAPINNQWHNSGDTANVSISGVFSRASGSGQRVSAFAIDGALTTVQPSTENISIPLLMETAHQLQIITVPQYQVALDSSAATMISSITPPTIAQDNYWYDEKTTVNLLLNGAANRTNGTGKRLFSFSVNGALLPVTSTGSVEALNIIELFSPQTVSAQLVTQYELRLPSGSVQSVTPPTIAADAGWYDSGTIVTVLYEYSWNVSAQSRTNAVSYNINQGANTPLSRAADGTFTVQIDMTELKTINVGSTQQYRFSFMGGNNVTLSQVSTTGDSFFDAGTALTVTSDAAWNLANGNTRTGLASYILDGTTTNITSTSGTFTLFPITFNSAHELTFNSATQYLAAFQFKDYNGAEEITPDSFQITTIAGIIDVPPPQFTVWLNSGTQFQIQSIIWQSAEVKPANQTTYTANGPLNETILCRVFNAKLVVQDSLGIPVAGAQVTVTLANQTIINAVTGADGTVNLPMIPQGTFTAAITYLGTTTTVTGDASVQAITTKAISTQPSPSPSPSTSPSPSYTPPPTMSPTATPQTSATPKPSATQSPAVSPTPAIPELTSTTIIGLMVVITALAIALKKKTAK